MLYTKQETKFKKRVQLDVIIAHNGIPFTWACSKTLKLINNRTDIHFTFISVNMVTNPREQSVIVVLARFKLAIHLI